MALPHAKALISGVMQGVNTMTTLHFMEPVDTLALKQQLAIDIRDNFMPNWKTGTAASMNFIAITITQFATPSDSPYTLVTNIVGSGTLHAQQTCFLTYLNTGSGGRRGKGRLYLPGIGQTAITEGKMSTSVQTSTTAGILNIKNRFAQGGTSDFTLGVYSRLDDLMRPVVDIQFSIIPCTLRSRKLGVGI